MWFFSDNNSRIPEADIDGKTWAEYWMGDHPNGPAHVFIDAEDKNHKKIFEYDYDFLEENHKKEIPLTTII